jgi:molybdenum cofactor biosynthesis protein B
VSVLEHRRNTPEEVRCLVVTVSDTRTVESDASGRAIADLLEADGHGVPGRPIVRDEPAEVSTAIDAHAGTVDLIVTTGGTGITSRDSTFEAVEGLLEKRLDGFGELFRMLSYAEIGSAAMLTRATGGVMRGTAIFMLPGSEHAVRLGMTKLILPEIGHVVRELKR